jgi:hypothetical protein
MKVRCGVRPHIGHSGLKTDARHFLSLVCRDQNARSGIFGVIRSQGFDQGKIRQTRDVWMASPNFRVGRNGRASRRFSDVIFQVC